MKRTSTFSAALIAWCVCAASAYGGDTYIAKYAGEFMAIGVGGRALGLGGAYVALANDVTAGYWNPAGLARINYPEFSLMHDEQFGSLENFDYAAVAFPYGSNDTTSATAADEDGTIRPVVNYNAATFGISVMRLGIDGIPDTRALDTNGDGVFNDLDARPDYSQITFFNSADWALYLSYAKQYSEQLYYGANVKLIRRDIGDFHATGIGFDLGGISSLRRAFPWARTSRMSRRHSSRGTLARTNLSLRRSKSAAPTSLRSSADASDRRSTPTSCSREENLRRQRISGPSVSTLTGEWSSTTKRPSPFASVTTTPRA